MSEGNVERGGEKGKPRQSLYTVVLYTRSRCSPALSPLAAASIVFPRIGFLSDPQRRY